MSKNEEVEVLYWVFEHSTGLGGCSFRTPKEAANYVKDLIQDNGSREEDITIIKGKKQEIKATEISIQDYKY